MADFLRGGGCRFSFPCRPALPDREIEWFLSLHGGGLGGDRVMQSSWITKLAAASKKALPGV